MSLISFDASACAYPAPRVSPLPGMRLSGLSASASQATAWQRRLGNSRCFKQARYALHAAYAAAGLQAGGTLLAPAYHCRTMLDPALRLDAAFALYPLNARLEPDLHALQALLQAGDGAVKAVLATHFFGFPQPMDAVARLCAKHGALLIEDCSHVSPSLYGTPGLGRSGAYAVGSIYKFSAAEDGGLLWSNPPQRLAAIEPTQARAVPGWRVEAQALLHAWQRGRRRLGSAPAPAGTATTATLPRGSDRHEPQLRLSAHYEADAAAEWAPSPRVSRWLARHTDYAAAARRRRANYLALLAGCRGLPLVQPWRKDLPEDVVPYMFPLLLQGPPEPTFDHLKRAGVPVGRWDDMVDSQCPHSRHYRLQLLHLPVHQDLGDAEMNWMLEQLAAALPTGRGDQA